MASEITTSPALVDATQAQTEPTPKRSLMPHKLLEAAIDGNEADLKRLLGLNDHSSHRRIPTEEMIQIEPSHSLIKSVAGMENTILHILSANDHRNLVSTICEKDSSLLKVRNVRNETPFHHAARFGHINTILVLTRFAKLEFREDSNVLKDLLRQKNCLGETALHEAARHGHGAVVSTLMEEDLELAGVVNDDSVSPLYLATARGSLDMVQNMVAKMLNHPNITPAFYSGQNKQTALHAAVLQDPGLTEELLQLYSAPLDKWADETGRTPLHLVASTGNHKIAKLLLDKDPSLVYIQDSDSAKSFPVHTAARMGHVKMIVLLLQRCRDSGLLLDSNGRNFLHIAIEANKSNVIFKLLKDSKKDLPTRYWKKMLNRMANTMDNKGNTPLHLAAEHGYHDVMLSLLENNELDLTLQNKKSLTAFDLCVIQLRKSAGNTVEHTFLSTRYRREALVEFYIQKRGARFSTGWFQHYTKGQMSDRELIRDTDENHISTTDARGAKNNSQGLMAKAQLVGLGCVLIVTVTFTAAFTLPGGTHQETGTPILGREHMFNAYVFTDFLAFIFSFLGTIKLIHSLWVHNSNTVEMHIEGSVSFFTISAWCMFIALGLGLYLVLAPLGSIGSMVLFLTVYATLVGMVTTFEPHYKHFRVQSKILKRIPYVPSGLNRNKIWWPSNTYPYINDHMLILFLSVLIVLAAVVFPTDRSVLFS